MFQLNRPTSQYLMPKCIHCGRRYKVLKDQCMRISFCSKDDKGNYHRETYYNPTRFCPKCLLRLNEIGPKAMLDEHIHSKG